MTCPKCRSDNPDGALYCAVCSESFVWKPPAAARPERTAEGGVPVRAVVNIAAAMALGWLGYRACGSGPGVGRLPALSLPRGGSGEEVALDACPTARCLTVYVAPWCPHCRASSALVKAVRDDVAQRGVTTRIVVGMDREDAVRAYAAEFGPDALLDAGGRLHVRGVPHVLVSDARGQVLDEEAGLPEIDPPADPGQLREIEKRFFGLP